MLVDGPVEWAEASVPAGNKLDLLRHAYNPRLGVAALPKGSTVVLARYSSDNESVSRSDEVLERAIGEVVLHPGDKKHASSEVYRYVSWSNGTNEDSNKKCQYVAIATSERVEIWQVRCEETLEAILIGSHSKNRIRGVSWNPVCDVVVVHNDVSVDLLEVTREYGLRVYPLDSTLSTMAEKAMHCVWSPCGLSLARSTEKSILFVSWQKVAELTTSAPTLSSYVIDSSSPVNLLTARPPIGSISATVLVSPSVCAIATDVPLVLDDVKHNEASSDRPSVAPSSFPSAIENTTPSNTIDLTSLRVTASSTLSLFNVIGQSKLDAKQVNGALKRSGHFVLAAKDTTGQWQPCCQLPLDQFAVPDILDVEAMRAVVGSTISNRIIVIHLDHSIKSGWSAAISGELELPDGHVCRGLRLARTSPFVQVASTEKARRTFFHASSGPQRIDLSKYKVPRRRRQAADHHTPATVPTTTSDAEKKAFSGQANADGFAAVLSHMEALQALIVTRFDQVERRLEEVDARLARLEVATKSSL